MNTQSTSGAGFDRFLGNLFGGITATLVILPISLAFGVATGLGASAGVYGAIAVGFFAAIFGGTPTQISGPTAPMSVAIAVIVTTHAQNLAEAFAIVILCGLFQIILGIIKIGRFIEYTPRVVVSGFMTGIGVIIIIIQLLPAIGADTASGGVIGALGVLPQEMLSANLDALIIAVSALAISIFWPVKLRRFLPAPLLALVVCTLMSLIWLPGVPVVGEIPKGLPELHIFVPEVDFLLRALEPALLLALLGAVDSLITSLIADTLTGTSHKPDRELIGQGIGNAVSGMIGGLPGSGATLGTVTNIRAGATSNASGIAYAIMMGLIVFVASDLVEPIPLAALAGVLIKVGYDVMDWRIVRRIHLIKRDRLLILLIVFALTIFVDLLTAVAIGLIAASMSHARTIKNFELDNIVSATVLDTQLFEGDEHAPKLDPFSARVGVISLNGVISIASKTNLVRSVVNDIKDHKAIILDFSNTQHIDDDIALVIEQLTEAAVQDNIAIIVSGLPAPIRQTIDALQVLHLVPKDRIVDTTEQAQQIAKQIIEPASTQSA